jgi:hypothetical protein
MNKLDFLKYSKRLTISPIKEKLKCPNELEVIRMKKILKFKKGTTPKPPRKIKKQSYLKGLRFSIKGRLKGARRARTMIHRYGSIGPNTYNKRSNSNQQVIFTK